VVQADRIAKAIGSPLPIYILLKVLVTKCLPSHCSHSVHDITRGTLTKYIRY